MKINNIKINGFGTLENREFNFGNSINLIIGNNEHGKSTLLKFIMSMFYGLPKNKAQGIEKFRPWNSYEFSGKLNYTLDNSETYSIYRDFNTKEFQLTNSNNNNDVSNNYSIDKTHGNLFFKEQTNVSRELFYSSYLIEQGKSKLDNNEQSSLIQAITNLISTGDEDISYNKAIDNLNKKIINEVGTDRTISRPINILNEKLEKLQRKKYELENSSFQKGIFEDQKKQLEHDINLEESKISLLKKIKNHIEQTELTKEKLKLNYATR